MKTHSSNVHSHRIFSSVITKFISHKSRTKPITGISNVCPRSNAAFPTHTNLSHQTFSLFDPPSGHEEEEEEESFCYSDDLFTSPPSPLGHADDSRIHTHMTSRQGTSTSPMKPNLSLQNSSNSPTLEQHFHNMDAQLDDAFKALFCSKTKAIPTIAPQKPKPLILTHVKPNSPRHRSPRKTPELLQTISEELEDEGEDQNMNCRRSVTLVTEDFETPPMSPLKAANKAKCPQLNVFLQSFTFFLASPPSPQDWSPRTPENSP